MGAIASGMALVMGLGMGRHVITTSIIVDRLITLPIITPHPLFMCRLCAPWLSSQYPMS